MIGKTNPLPAPEVPLVDVPSGRVTRDWYTFLKTVVDRINALISMVGTGSTVVGSLPSAATVGAGARAFVTDATSTTFHATVAGGGSNKVPVVSDGTNWLIG
jgi:hypothetical protein